MEDYSSGDSDVVNGEAVDAPEYVVELRPEGKLIVPGDGNIRAGSVAERKRIIGRDAKDASREMRAAYEGLEKWNHFVRAANGKPRAEGVGEGVDAHARRRSVVIAEVTDAGEPIREVVRCGAADAVQAEASATCDTHVGIRALNVKLRDILSAGT